MAGVSKKKRKEPKNFEDLIKEQKHASSDMALININASSAIDTDKTPDYDSLVANLSQESLQRLLEILKNDNMDKGSPSNRSRLNELRFTARTESKARIEKATEKSFNSEMSIFALITSTPTTLASKIMAHPEMEKEVPDYNAMVRGLSAAKLTRLLATLKKIESPPAGKLEGLVTAANERLAAITPAPEQARRRSSTLNWLQTQLHKVAPRWMPAPTVTPKSSNAADIQLQTPVTRSPDNKAPAPALSASITSSDFRFQCDATHSARSCNDDNTRTPTSDGNDNKTKTSATYITRKCSNTWVCRNPSRGDYLS